MTQDWTLEEALAYYRRQGAPGEQGALVALLREVQEERGGALPAADLAEIAAALSLRDTFLSAIIRRYPGLRTEEAPPPPGAVRRPPLLRPGRGPSGRLCGGDLRRAPGRRQRQRPLHLPHHRLYEKLPQRPQPPVGRRAPLPR